MIVCSCNIVTRREIADAIAQLRANDPYVVITPGLIFRALGKRPQCGTCLQLVTQLTMEGEEASQVRTEPPGRTCAGD